MTDAYTPPQSDLTEPNLNLGEITDGMVNALRGTKAWVLLFGILMFIGAAFMVIGGLGMMLGGTVMGTRAGGAPQGMFAGMGVIYLLMALLYIFPATYLVKYSSAIGRLVNDGRAADMETALRQQQKFWKFAGVLALIFTVIGVVGIVAAIAIPMWMAMHR